MSKPNQEDPDNKKYKKQRKNKKTPSLFNQIGIGGLQSTDISQGGCS